MHMRAGDRQTPTAKREISPAQIFIHHTLISSIQENEFTFSWYGVLTPRCFA